MQALNTQNIKQVSGGNNGLGYDPLAVTCFTAISLSTLFFISQFETVKVEEPRTLTKVTDLYDVDGNYVTSKVEEIPY